MIVVFSWDDGHPLDARVAELLATHGFKGTFFVPGSNREGLPVMSNGALRALGADHEVGSHTLGHVYLRGEPESVVREQITAGKAKLESVLGRSVLGFCYPGGQFDSTAVRIVQEAGFRYARSVENLVTTAPRDRFRVATTLQLYPHPTATLTRNLLRYAHRLRKLPLLLQLAGARTLAQRLTIAAAYARRHEGVLHIWGHSWELERHDLWGTLSEFLRRTRELSPRCLTLSELTCL
jgi:peptidoglycan-N-acetylglucosamine deacetylase